MPSDDTTEDLKDAQDEKVEGAEDWAAAKDEEAADAHADADKESETRDDMDAK